jgi:aryl-alcohol dehydrogenase-like predicted oxidoreductase
MQYRRCFHSGLALSVVRLRLSAHNFRRAADMREIVERALEHGINAFQIDSADIGFLSQVSQVLKVVDRSILFVSLTARDNLGVSYGGAIDSLALKQRLSEAVRLPGLQRLDMVTFQSAEFRALTAEDHAFLRHLGEAHRVGQIGVQVEPQDYYQVVDSGHATAILTDFDVTASKTKRHMIEDANRRNISVLSQNHYPARLIEGRSNESIRSQLQNVQAGAMGGGADKYSFLTNEIGWTAEEICLGFTLSQPQILSVGVVARSIEHLDGLAGVVGRSLPRTLHAHLELGTFSVDSAA